MPPPPPQPAHIPVLSKVGTLRYTNYFEILLELIHIIKKPMIFMFLIVCVLRLLICNFKYLCLTA